MVEIMLTRDALAVTSSPAQAIAIAIASTCKGNRAC
ncbi:hypothetical protein ACVIIV_007218 [Bradyrhizobium sp. USDA 4354]